MELAPSSSYLPRVSARLTQISWLSAKCYEKDVVHYLPYNEFVTEWLQSKFYKINRVVNLLLYGCFDLRKYEICQVRMSLTATVTIKSDRIFFIDLPKSNIIENDTDC